MMETWGADAGCTDVICCMYEGPVGIQRVTAAEVKLSAFSRFRGQYRVRDAGSRAQWRVDGTGTQREARGGAARGSLNALLAHARRGGAWGATRRWLSPDGLLCFERELFPRPPESVVS